MRSSRLLNWFFILVILFTPLLSACQRSQPTAAQKSAAPLAAAAATQLPAPTPEPSAIPSPTPTRAPLPPIVVKVTPEAGEEQKLTQPVVVTFDQPMDPSTTQAAFSIQPKVEGQVKVQGTDLVFTPAQPLKRAAQYVVSVKESAASAHGLKLAQPVSLKFATVGFLEVTNNQPADKATDVPVDATITIGFNRPVVPLTGVKEQAQLPTPLIITPSVTGKSEWLNTGIYQFTPDKGLAAATDYTVTVKAGLQDTTGALLDQNYSFSFRTTDPTVISWSPENTSNFKVESPISVTFSMPMDPVSSEAAFTLAGPNKAAVTGAFSWNQEHTQLGFRPVARLAYGANYVATVAKTARPANGQGTLREQAVQRFSTVYTPRIIKTQPADKATADPFETVVFSFASPIAQSSFITGSYTILPKPTQVYTGYNDYQNEFYLNFDKLPATAYTVTLSGKLADPYGNTLGQDYVLHFTTRDYEPLLQLNSPGNVGTYNAYTNTQAIVTYVNVPEILFRLYKVPQADFIVLTGQGYWEKWQSYTPKPANLVREWGVTTPAARNKTGFLRTDLTDKDGKQLPPGNYWLDISGSGFRSGDKTPSRFRQLLARTDLNVTLKTEQAGALAWVTDLKSGLPAEGIKVRFTDAAKLDQEATTDKDGVARIVFNAVHNPYDQLTVMAAGDNGQFGVASNMWEDGISAWSFNLPGGGFASAYNGYVYTDRPIYRPNQTVYWKAVIRRDNDAVYSLPAAGQPVTVTIRDDQGNALQEQKMTLDPLGTLDGKLTLGQEAVLGYYNISVQMPGDPQIKDMTGPAFGVGFEVAEYRKPEYEISAVTDKPEYVQGQEIKVTTQAGYYFGGPVKNGLVHWVLSSVDYGFQYAGKGNFSWMDWDWYNQSTGPRFSGALSQGNGRTDAEGRFTFSVPADVGKFTQSQRFTFDITVTDVNNQAVSAQASAVVHLGEFYIGLGPQSYVATVGEKNRVDVLTVDPQSRPASHTDVTVIANQVEWYTVREQAEDGRYYLTSKARLTPAFTQTLTTDNQGSAVFEWTPKKGGEYKIAAAGRDMAGHVIRSAAYVWVSDSSYVLWRQDNNDRIQLVADKNQYAVGEVAELLVASPYQTPVKALLTVERNHVLTYQIIELKGNSDTLRIPIKADYAPDVFVSIVLVKGMDGTSAPPSFKMGLAQLKVSVADKVLSVIVKPETPAGQTASGAATGAAQPPHVGPRDTVTWTVKTLDAAGQPVKASVSLALVDKAILALASDQAGTLLDRFYSQRALGVRTASTLVVNIDRIVAQLTQGGKGGGGGDGGPGGRSVRTEFPDIAFWRANVQTDATGTAQVAVTLPDNLTTWTMDARAVTPDTLVGQTQTDIIATKDLLVRPVLPRFLVEGDQAEIAAIIHNNTDQPLETTIQFKLTGLEPAGGATNQATVATVAAGGTYKAMRPVKVQANMDQVAVEISAAGGKLSDAVEMTLPVYRYTTPEVTGTSGQVAQDESRLELVRLPAAADPTRGQLDVTIEPSLAAGMTGGLTYLEHFPYECTEQTISRFLPNVATYRALSKLNISQPDLQAKLGQQVGVGLQRIYGQQHLDGGWGWWQTDESNAWTSAYVVYGLAKAREAGFTVDQLVLDRSLRYLESTLRAPSELSNWELNRQAFIVYALAVAGDPQPNRAGGLYEVREKLSLYSEGYLALALGLIKDDASAGRIKTLLADLNGKAITSATSTHWEEGWTDYWNMNTDTRSTSIVLEVLATLDPQNSLAPNAVRWLMVARQGDRWQTTQENAWAIMALTDWMVASGELQGNYSWKVLLNDQALGQGAVTPASVREPAQLHADVAKLLLDQTNGLLIQRNATAGQTGNGQLYYTAYLKTYLPVEELQPVDRGVVVSREYRMADCVNPPVLPAGDQMTEQEREKACPTVTQARVGDVINVKLNIVVPHSLYYVVVEDPLPAGTEAVDTSLLTTSRTAQGPQMEMAPDETGKSPKAWNWWWTPTHTELRDEKVALFATSLAPGAYQFTYQIRASVPGQFLTLPPTGYQMYFPEVWGRGAGSLFTVTE